MALYVPLLRSCTTPRSLFQIHAQLLTAGLHCNPLLYTKLIESYANMNLIDTARLVFDNFSTPDSFMWGVMIKSYVLNLHFKQAISLYHHGLQDQRFSLNSFVLTPVLQACSKLYDITMGRKIHGQLIKHGLESDSVVETALLQMYGEGGEIEDAYQVFNEMPSRDVVSSSLMISTFVQCGQAIRGLNLFSRIYFEKIELDCVLTRAVAAACTDMGLLREAKSVHGHILRKWTKTDQELLVTMYIDCCDLESAKKLLKNLSKMSVVSWTAMISLYNKRSCYREALRVCWQMLEAKTEPNSVTIMGILYSCTQLIILKEGKSAHGFSIRRGLDSLGSSLIKMYSSFRNLRSCFSVFEEIENKTIVSWNSLIVACTHNCFAEKALELFAQVLSEELLPDSFTLSSVLSACAQTGRIFIGRQMHGVANKIGLIKNTFVQNSLIDMYCKCKSIDTAFEMFQEINVKTVVTWNTIISGLSDGGFSEKAIKLFEQMHYDGIEMDSVTYLSGIKACTHLGFLAKGRWIHHKLLTSGLKKDIDIDASLTNMYAKCGDIATAKHVFDSASHKNVVLWSSVISGYGYHGLVSETISLFSEMVAAGVRPNEVTFTAVLCACCHAGLTEEGLFYFEMMRKFDIEPQLDHHASIVDLLSRAGQIDGAYYFIESMKVKPDARIWRALLHGCHIHQREDIACFVQRRML